MKKENQIISNLSGGKPPKLPDGWKWRLTKIQNGNHWIKAKSNFEEYFLAVHLCRIGNTEEHRFVVQRKDANPTFAICVMIPPPEIK